MLNPLKFATEPAPLQEQAWPPVERFGGFDRKLEDFLRLPATEQRSRLVALRHEPEEHGAMIQKFLGTIYGYAYGYHDSPCHLETRDDLEAQLYRAKIILEREMLEHFLRPAPIPQGLSAKAACDYLRHYAATNAGVAHPFFDFIAESASRAAMVELLRCEVIRNEVVDDEVAHIVIGLQGLMKKIMASNLSDECGNGKLSRFHTYWLRRLLERTDDWEGIRDYRRRSVPWFANIVSNSLNMLLTRSAYKYRAYGHFLITEAWVAPHFEKILSGLRRVGLDHEDITVYFSQHLAIDPHHTEEMLEGILHQRPALADREIEEILWGAHSAVSAALHMYRRMLEHLSVSRGMAEAPQARPNASGGARTDARPTLLLVK
jgi:hypothetical protein